jgi:hypothetical protein
VTEQSTLVRVADSGVVRELVDLPDIVQESGGQEQIRVDAG